MSSNFGHLYKNKEHTTQAERREQLLQYFKQRRNDTVDEKRKLTELFDDDSDNTDVEEELEFQHSRFHKKSSQLKLFFRKLMLSEWFKDIPEDLEQNWLVKLCPVGTRSLVVATQNITVAYNRIGQQKCVFQSLLPGGGSATNGQKFTILDCIFSKKKSCYYILDIIAWNSLCVKHCDAEFRFCWLNFKMQEDQNLQEKHTLNIFPFFLIDHFAAEISLLEDKFSRPYSEEENHSAELDGVLFYHRHTHYIKGATPLVGWLKGYMLPEILNIPVHDSYLRLKPKKYTTLHDYLQRKDELNRKKSCENMEVETCS